MVERLKSLMITGAPCTGKSTLTKYCKETWSLEKIPGHTTRAQRSNEFYGYDFIYIGISEFIDNYLNGIYCDPSFLVTQYNNNLYGSPSTWISLLQEKEHKIIFTPTSTITAEYIKRVSPINLAWIHLFADSEDRDQRLMARNISPNEINYRLTSGDSQGVNKSADVNINTSHMCEREIMNSIYFHIKLP